MDNEKEKKYFGLIICFYMNITFMQCSSLDYRYQN